MSQCLLSILLSNIRDKLRLFFKLFIVKSKLLKRDIWMFFSKSPWIEEWSPSTCYISKHWRWISLCNEQIWSNFPAFQSINIVMIDTNYSCPKIWYLLTASWWCSSLCLFSLCMQRIPWMFGYFFLKIIKLIHFVILIWNIF